MKNIIAVLFLLTLTACCGCMPPKKTSLAHEGLTCSTVKVSGMTCEACASTVTANLKKSAGVKDVQVDVATGTVKIYTEGTQKLSSTAVKSIVERSGYTFTSLQPSCSQ